MKNNIILVDPPWQYKDKSLNRGGAERHYSTMTLDEMRNLDVISLAANECALCMWVTMPHLETAFDLIRSWGFVPVTALFVWVKTYKNGDPSNPFIGMGHYTRSNAEIMLLAKPKSGRVPKRLDAGIRQIQYAPVQEHSKKPDKFRDLLLQLFGDLPRVELFARDKAPGWKSWGNEVESDVEMPSRPYPSLMDSYKALIAHKKPHFGDYRAICPACFAHTEIMGFQIGDGGGLKLECDKCGYTKVGQSTYNFETAVATITRAR